MQPVLPFSPPLFRIGLVAMGITALWYGTEQATVAGLIAMLVGLVAVVGALSLPRLSFRAARPVMNFAANTPVGALQATPLRE